MIRRLRHVFALSERGAKDFVKAVIWCFFCNISLMLPVGVVMAVIQYLLGTLEAGGNPAEGYGSIQERQFWSFWSCSSSTISSTRPCIWLLTRKARQEE